MYVYKQEDNVRNDKFIGASAGLMFNKTYNMLLGEFWRCRNNEKTVYQITSLPVTVFSKGFSEFCNRSFRVGQSVC